METTTTPRRPGRPPRPRPDHPDPARPDQSRLDRIESKLDELLGMLRNPVESRASYSVEEVATMLGVAENTVRVWCRHGRIEAAKRVEKRGGVELWSIAAAEVTRYRDEGLRPMDPKRNEGRRG